MGRHSEWRKIAKKLRRKRIRQEAAKIRDENEEKERLVRESSPTFIKLREEQEKAELFQQQEEERLAKQRDELWRKTEEEAQRQWQELQAKLAQIRQERYKQEERIRDEWKREQEKIKAAKEKAKQVQEENERKLDEAKRKIDEYITNGGQFPEELNSTLETNPGKPVCPFFQKTGACRFKDVCSRNHVRPGVSKVLLVPGFYTHFSLEHGTESEHGSDLMLEYEDRETYNHFREFFDDILPEFEKCGVVRQLKVCCNKEPHLRGNVYVEYATVREALRAYKLFQGRFYGGKQLNVEFCTIPSWKSAICGLNFLKRCPKGSSCNFLHVFANPGKMFHKADRDLHRSPVHFEEENESEHSRRWRWSESPERIEKENYIHKHTNGKEKRDNEKRRKRRRSSRTTRTSSSRSRRSRSPSSQRRKRHKHSHKD